jgi:hypothetical protein
MAVVFVPAYVANTDIVARDEQSAMIQVKLLPLLRFASRAISDARHVMVTSDHDF